MTGVGRAGRARDCSRSERLLYCSPASVGAPASRAKEVQVACVTAMRDVAHANVPAVHSSEVQATFRAQPVPFVSWGAHVQAAASTDCCGVFGSNDLQKRPVLPDER